MKRITSWVTVMVTLLLVVAACAAPTPAVVEKEVIVEKEVPVTVEVEKEKVVEKPVVETVVVEKEVPITVEVEKEKVVEKEVEVVRRPPDAAEEQILRIAIGGEAPDPSPLRGGGWMSFWLSFWWSPLMYIDENAELQPAIVESWESSDDFMVWTFHLDPSAVWSDGSPITAGDVKGTWELSALPETKHQRISLFVPSVVGYDAVTGGEATEMEGLTVKDDHTLEVTLSDPDPVFHMRIATNFCAPVKIDQVRGEDGLEKPQWYLPENNPAVSGPFMPEEFDLDAGEFVFVPNPNWWRWPPPILEKVVIQSIPDHPAMATMFKSGQLDATNLRIPRDLVPDLPELFEGPLHATQNMFFLAATHEPTDDIHVRKALIHAVDVEAVYKASFPAGQNAPQTQALNPVVSCYDPTIEGYDYDPDLAKAELAASKYGSAENLPKLYIVGTGQIGPQRAAEAIAEFWRKHLGITRVELKAQFDDFVGPENVQVFRDNTGARFPDGATLMWTTAHSEGPFAQNKMFGYKNPEVDRLLDEAMSKTVDDPDRCRLTQEAQRLFMDDYMFIPWMYEDSPRLAMSYVKNWHRNDDWQIISPHLVYIAEH